MGYPWERHLQCCPHHPATDRLMLSLVQHGVA